MAREVRNVGASVRARLLDRARAESADFQILLTRYALERLLYRLSLSAHRDRFILKGAMLLTTWVPDRFRSTRDLDLLGYGENSPERIADAFQEICAQRTFARRETALPGETPVGLSDAYVETWGRQWRAFLGRERMAAAPEALADVVADLRRFLLPLAEDVAGNRRWRLRVGWVSADADAGGP